MHAVLQMHEGDVEDVIVVSDLEAAQEYLDTVGHHIPMQPFDDMFNACDDEGHGYQVYPVKTFVSEVNTNVDGLLL